MAFVLAGCIDASIPARPGVDEYPVGMTHATSAEIAQTIPGLSPSLRISPKIMRTCYVHFDQIDPGLRLGLDPSSLDPLDQLVLAQVAQCVTDGPLAGRAIRVGRIAADGDAAEQAHRLGDSIERYLVRFGLDAARVTQIEKSAAGHVRDGRVDVELAPK